LIFVWGKLIMATVDEIFEHLQDEVDARGLPYFEKVRYSGRNIMTNCIAHKGGMEQHPSMGILREEVERNGKKYPAGMVNCFKCGYSVDLPTFVSDTLGLGNPAEGYKWLISNFVYGVDSKRSELNIDLTREKSASKTFDRTNISYYYSKRKQNPQATEYLTKERGLKEAVLDRFEIGYNPAHNSIVFPVMDRKGNVLFFKEKPLDKADQRYYNERDVEKSKTLYGIHEVKPGNMVYLVEGEIDALTVWGWGYPACAIMGSVMFATQADELVRAGVDRVILAFDNDEAGRKVTQQAKDLLIKKSVRVYYFYWGDKVEKDVNELDEIVFKNCRII